MSQEHSPSHIIAAAETAVSSITDPELKRVAFEKALELSSGSQTSSIESASRLIQVLSVVAGVIISVLSFNASRQSEAHARQEEAEARKLDSQRYQDQRRDEEAKRHTEAAKPFLELRQKLYLEAVQVAAVLANPEGHTEDELKVARTRFRDLYVAELSLIEGIGVESGMIGLAKVVEPELAQMNEKQKAAYALAHALRDSLVKSWNLKEEVVDNPNQ
jgi:hypothetical protein